MTKVFERKSLQHSRAGYLINGLTVYRLFAAVLLLYLVVTHNIALFRWMLAISFFTDAIDGWLARRFNVISVLGARLDSIADDATVAIGALGIILFQPSFIKQEWLFLSILLGFYLLQLLSSLIVYGRPTSFHTWSAKIAAVAQGTFLILFFFLDTWPMALFYIAGALTLINLLEELLLVFILPTWRSDVKGLWWILMQKIEEHKN